MVGITGYIRMIDFDRAAETVLVAEAVQVIVIEVEGIKNRRRKFLQSRIAPDGNAPPALRAERNLEHMRTGLKKRRRNVQILLSPLDMGANESAPLLEAVPRFE